MSKFMILLLVKNNSFFMFNSDLLSQKEDLIEMTIALRLNFEVVEENLDFL